MNRLVKKKLLSRRTTREREREREKESSPRISRRIVLVSYHIEREKKKREKKYTLSALPSRIVLVSFFFLLFFFHSSREFVIFKRSSRGEKKTIRRMARLRDTDRKGLLTGIDFPPPSPKFCASMFHHCRIDRPRSLRLNSRDKYIQIHIQYIYLLSTRSLRPLPLGRRIDRSRADHARRRQLAARRFRLAAAAIRRILSLF